MLPLFWAAVGPDPSGKHHLPPASECARGCVGDCVKNSFVPVAQKNEGDPPNDEAKYLTQNRPPPRRSSGTLPSFSLALPPTNCSTCEVGENLHWIVDVETKRCEVPCRGCMPNKLRAGIGRVGIILIRELRLRNQYSANRCHGPFVTTTSFANRDYLRQRSTKRHRLLIHQSLS